MDLAPGRSFIEWAVQHERTLDDYLIGGPVAALDVITGITGASQIDIAGLCLGGALTAMPAAYLAATGADWIGSLPLLNTLLDYSEPGVLGVFTDEPTVARLERQMAAKGFLEGSQMSSTFDLLRANDLIFSYVTSNWLMGGRRLHSTSSPGTATARACPRPCTRPASGRSTSITSSPRAGWNWAGSTCPCRTSRVTRTW